MAYVTLFTWSFLAATLLPLGSEPALVVLVRRGYPPLALVVVATVGNYLGACTTYWLARVAAAALREREASASAHRAARWLSAYGQPALLLSWVPIVGDAIVAAAGAARVPFGPFSGWTIGGKLARYLVVAWGAHAW